MRMKGCVEVFTVAEVDTAGSVSEIPWGSYFNHYHEVERRDNDHKTAFDRADATSLVQSESMSQSIVRQSRNPQDHVAIAGKVA